MITLFSYDGNPVAYIADDPEHSIYLCNGTPVAYMVGNEVYGYNGIHLGWYENDIMWDLYGFRIGFSKETCPNISFPVPDTFPNPLNGDKLVRAVSKVKPAFVLLRSHQVLEDFLSLGSNN